MTVESSALECGFSYGIAAIAHSDNFIGRQKRNSLDDQHCIVFNISYLILPLLTFEEVKNPDTEECSAF